MSGSQRTDPPLAQAVTIGDTLQFIDFAEAARVYAQQVERSVSAMNYATTLKLLAELKLADMVDAGQKAGQIAEKKDGRPNKCPPPDTYRPSH